MSYTVHHKLMTLGQLEDYAERLMIPLWQRDYDWTKPQWTSLAETLCSASPELPAFLGTIVLVKRQDQLDSPKSKPQPSVVFDVVDGQQRLTTLHHLLSLLLKQKGLPLSRGRLALPQAVEPPDDLKGFTDAFRKAADHLRKRPSDWTEAVTFAVTILEPDKNADAHADARCASRLGAQFFTRLNRQRRMLSALDEAKARLVLDLQDKDRADDKSISVAEHWERLRRTVWTLEGLDLKKKRSPERLKRQERRFMRILLTLWRTTVHAKDFQGFTVDPEDPDASFREQFVRKMKETPGKCPAFIQRLHALNALNDAPDGHNTLLERLQSGLLLARNKEDEALLLREPWLPNVLALLQLQAFQHGYHQEQRLESEAFAVVLSHLTDEKGPTEREERAQAMLKALKCWLARQADRNARLERLRSGLLLARNKEDEALLFGLELDSDALALLQLQAFLHGHYQERWLESEAFAVVVFYLTDGKNPPRDSATRAERVRKTLKALERWLARQAQDDMENNREKANACDHTPWRLLWREWVLLRGIWSRTEPYFGVVKAAIDAWAKMEPSSEDALRKSALSTFNDAREITPCLENGLPDRWAGTDTEHWVPLERGEKTQRKVLDGLLNGPHNFAHIAKSLNSSWRNSSIGTKTVRLIGTKTVRPVDDKAEKAWPTLIVCAALTRAQETAGVPLPSDQFTEASLDPYIKRMKAFWAVIDNSSKQISDVEAREKTPEGCGAPPDVSM